MANIITLLIDKSHQRLVGFVLWFVAFALALGLAAFFTAHQVGENMLAQAHTEMNTYIRLRTNVLATFTVMETELTATPCSPEFHDQMRKVAYLPDGLNEFLYVPDGVAHCTVNADFEPISLGPPDVDRANPFAMSFWFDRDLGFLGLEGFSGSIAVRGSLGMIIPAVKPSETQQRWMSQETVLVAPGDDRWWHRTGEPGIYDEAKSAGPLGSLLPVHNGAFYATECDPIGLHCVATRATLANLFAFGSMTVVAAIIICALLGLGVAGQLHKLIWRFWSFKARFRRNFKYKNIICVYQPVMELKTGAIIGCEVLVRWRDFDGTMVFPDQFLPVVEKHGLGLQLTRFVANRAHEELSQLIPPGRRLQVNINIFPRDFDAAKLRDVLSAFDQSAGRFDLVVEIVESDEIEIAHAQREIEALRREGIRTHLDDFGTGYSNIQNLASLALDGVKVDRSFAMAKEGTLMDKMLQSAIDMIHAAGRRITIEGVETEERLAMLEATGQVDFVQGYLISRPLDIGRFAQFLDEHPVKVEAPRLVA